MFDPTDVAISPVPDEMVTACNRKLAEGIACPRALGRAQAKVITAKLWELKAVMDAPQTACRPRLLDRRAIHQPQVPWSIVLRQDDATAVNTFGYATAVSVRRCWRAACNRRCIEV